MYLKSTQFAFCGCPLPPPQSRRRLWIVPIPLLRETMQLVSSVKLIRETGQRCQNMAPKLIFFDEKKRLKSELSDSFTSLDKSDLRQKKETKLSRTLLIRKLFSSQKFTIRCTSTTSHSYSVNFLM